MYKDLKCKYNIKETMKRKLFNAKKMTMKDCCCSRKKHCLFVYILTHFEFGALEV
jgi:hypothetical protein